MHLTVSFAPAYYVPSTAGDLSRLRASGVLMTQYLSRHTSYDFEFQSAELQTESHLVICELSDARYITVLSLAAPFLLMSAP